MIRRLTGHVIDANHNSIVLDVGGVGYLVYTSNPGTNFARECDVTVWTYHVVRETVADLYGFTTRDELDVFELLLTLPKIGPKSAGNILANADIALLKKAVSEADPTYLSKMSGIGKKTAENIVNGLKDKFTDIGNDPTTSVDGTNVNNALHSDTIDALIALGYPQNEARNIIQKLPPDITTANEAVRAALKLLS